MLRVKEKGIVHHLSKVSIYVFIVTAKPWNAKTFFEELSPLFIMEKEQGLGVLCIVLDEREEVVVHRERNVCDPVLSVGIVLVSKEQLW